MKKVFLFCLIPFLVTASCSSQNTNGFVSLFNGKDLSDWTLEKPGGFEVIDGGIVTKSFGAGNDIYSNKWYGNFILRLEFMLSEVGNSGVFIRLNPNVQSSGFEVQLLAPWTPWRDDLHCTGSLYGYVPVINRPDETTGIWYKMEIKCDRNFVTVSVNDKATTIADIDTVKTFVNKPYHGVIGFQGNHASKQGQFAKFRNIFIRDLDTEPEYVKMGFYNKDIQFRNYALVSAVAIGADMVDPLSSIMSGDDPIAKSGAKDALFNIVAKASHPEAPAKEKKDVTAALKKSIRKSTTPITKNYLKWLSGLIID